MFSEEINRRIRLLYQNEPELCEKILFGDVEAIRNMALDNDFSATTVVYALENNKVEELYKEAKKRIEMFKLYKDLCEEVAVISLKELDNDFKRKSK